MAAFFITPRCPFEILSTIFILCVEDFKETARCLPEATSTRPPPSPGSPRLADRTQLPQALTLVCHSWRDVALGTSRLWASFCFTLGSEPSCPWTDEPPTQKHIQGIRRWLERSRASPLTVATIYRPRGEWDPAPTEAILRAIYRMLCDRSNQWYDMRLCWTCLSSPQLGIPALSLPRLFRMSCHFNVGVVKTYDPILLDGIPAYTGNNLEFSNAPNLREVLIDSITIGLVDFKLPWAQLRSLAFRGDNNIQDDELYVADCLAVFSHCESLTDLKIYWDSTVYSVGDDQDYFPKTQMRIVTLPLLTHLIVSTRDLRIGFGVLPHLRFPLLETLSLSHDEFAEGMLDAILQPITTTHPPLRMLHIDDSHGLFHGTDFLNLLSSFPGITSLSTNVYYHTQQVLILYLILNDESTSAEPIVPQLKELCLSADDSYYENQSGRDYLWNFVSSRWNRPAPARPGEIGAPVISHFRRVRLNGLEDDSVKDEIRECLKEFTDEGLELEFYESGMASAVWKAAGTRWPCEM